jgi:hypothetical protein
MPHGPRCVIVSSTWTHMGEKKGGVGPGETSRQSVRGVLWWHGGCHFGPAVHVTFAATAFFIILPPLCPARCFPQSQYNILNPFYDNFHRIAPSLSRPVLSQSQSRPIHGYLVGSQIYHPKLRYKSQLWQAIFCDKY